MLARIGGLQCALETHSTPNLRKLEIKLKQEYVNILLQEEFLWKQRSTCNWNLNGDRNTSFFHAYVKKRAKNKKFDMLKLRSGDWCSDENVLKTKVFNYFSNLYTHDGVNYKPWGLKRKFSTLSPEEYEALARDVSDEEVRAALFQMASLKASGIDGVQAFFFQKHWGVVGVSICRIVRNIFNGGVIDESICRTLIVLIPKQDNLKVSIILDR